MRPTLSTRTLLVQFIYMSMCDNVICQYNVAIIIVLRAHIAIRHKCSKPSVLHRLFFVICQFMRYVLDMAAPTYSLGNPQGPTHPPPPPRGNRPAKASMQDMHRWMAWDRVNHGIVLYNWTCVEKMDRKISHFPSILYDNYIYNIYIRIYYRWGTHSFDTIYAY